MVLSVLALVTAGTALAYRASTAGSRAARGSGDDAALGSEVLQLREQVASLTERLTQLESREGQLLTAPLVAHGGETASARMSAAPAIDDEMLDDVRTIAAALRDGEGAGAEQLEQLMLDVVERREQEQADARTERTRQFMEERTQEQVATLVEELGLDKYQEDQVWKLIDSQTERRENVTAIFQSRDMSRMGEARDELRTMRDEADSTFRGFLSGAQIAQYEELGGQRMPGSPFGGGWGGGGRGRSSRGGNNP